MVKKIKKGNWYCPNCKKIPDTICQDITEKVVSGFYYRSWDKYLKQVEEIETIASGESKKRGKPYCPTCTNRVIWKE